MGDGTDPVKGLAGQQPPEAGEQAPEAEEQVGDVKEQVDEKMGPGGRLGDFTDEGKDSSPRT
jgi:hypothetical protein